MRLPYAARQLIDETRDINRRVQFLAGDTDGLLVYRSLTFDAKTAKWLEPVLEACADERIVSLERTERSRLTVTFVADRRADDVRPFGVEAAYRVLND